MQPAPDFPALVRRLERAPRWPYCMPGAIALLFVGHAYEDGGPVSAAIYGAIVVLSIVQSVRSTILGWILLFGPFAAYVVAVALSAERDPIDEWLLFLTLGLVPVVAMWAGLPWKQVRL